MSPDHPIPPAHGPMPLEELFGLLARLAGMHDGLPDSETPLGRSTRDFFRNNWINCRDGLLSKTSRIRVDSEPVPEPRLFQFAIDLPYKRKRGPEAPVELMPGPIRGLIIYRPDLLANMHEPGIAVRLDRTPGFLHPNYSRRHGLLCLGELPPGPFPLDALLEDHLFPILSYQNRRAAHPADLEAARYFALDPEAMSGLDRVEPLY